MATMIASVWWVSYLNRLLLLLLFIISSIKSNLLCIKKQSILSYEPRAFNLERPVCNNVTDLIRRFLHNQRTLSFSSPTLHTIKNRHSIMDVKSAFGHSYLPLVSSERSEVERSLLGRYTVEDDGEANFLLPIVGRGRLRHAGMPRRWWAG